jgi:hypothetical protein
MKTSILKNLFALAMIFFGFAAVAQNTIKTNDLEILLVTDYVHVYSDYGTGAGMDLSIWKQKLENGFYSLGHYAQVGYAAPQAVTIMVKGLTNGSIAQPTSFTRFYTDAGTGGNQDLALWIPVAPSGYMALGLVATNGGQPSAAEVVCVRSDLVTLAMAGSQIWNDAGSGGNQDLALWRINPPSFPKDSKYSYITSGSFCGQASRAKPQNSNVTYALKVLIPADEKKVTPQRPQLSGMNKPAEKTDLVLTSISKLPCVSINDAVYVGNAARQVRETPGYRLERYDYYQLQDFNTSTSPNEGKMTFEMTTGMTTSHEKSIQQTFGTSATATAGVESGIYSASVSITVSYALSQSESISESEMKERTATKEFTVPAKGAGALYNLCHQYVLKRANGEVIDTWVLSTNNSHFTDFSPKANTNTNTNTNTNSNSNAKLPVSIAEIQGTYRREVYVNDWHEGYIDNNFKWSNNAGASWTHSMTPTNVTGNSFELMAGSESPYYQYETYRSYKFYYANGKVIGFTFGGEPEMYKRISNNKTNTTSKTNKASASDLWASTKWGGEYFKALMGDINGDGKADRILYHQVEGNWYGLITDGEKPSWDTEKWGGNRYIGMVADINGDGKVDRIVYDPVNGDWGGRITGGGKTSWDGTQWGSQNYVPMMADVDGDGKADRVVYNTVSGDWGCIPEKGSVTDISWNATSWGGTGYVAMMGDVDGDGKADRIVYNQSNGNWGVRLQKGGNLSWNGTKWGSGNYVALMGDVDGDGKSDRIVYDTNTGNWGCILANGQKGSFDTKNFGGNSSFIPISADVNGDGKAERVIYSETPGTWKYEVTD